jgi:CrcB protein
MIATGFIVLAAVGTLARWQFARLNRPEWAGGTLIVNLGAAFLVGILHDSSTNTLTLAGVALLGTYSTFSTVIREVTDTAEADGLAPAGMYLAVTLVGGLAAAGMGVALS